MGRGRPGAGWGAVVTCAVLVSATAAPAEAQQWSWPERAEDLRELPADFPPERLSAVMRGFTSALGVRCSYCHVGEEGRPLSTYDFVSTENPNKERAREMLRLLGSVNDHLDRVERSGEPVNMWCHTCHQGRPRPQTLAEAVGERVRSDGGEAGVAYFLELRERFYGGPGYDFRPAAVAALAAGLLEEGEPTGARRIAELNVGHHPESWEAHEGVGDLLAAMEDVDGARAAFERALELSPENPRVTAKLRRLGGGR